LVVVVDDATMVLPPPLPKNRCCKLMISEWKMTLYELTYHL
jgi:hypothetical protein